MSKLARSLCSYCEELQDITSSDIALEYKTDFDFSRLPVGRARYWTICNHPDLRKPKENGKHPLCEGSGSRV